MNDLMPACFEAMRTLTRKRDDLKTLAGNAAKRHNRSEEDRLTAKTIGVNSVLQLLRANADDVLNNPTEFEPGADRAVLEQTMDATEVNMISSDNSDYREGLRLGLETLRYELKVEYSG